NLDSAMTRIFVYEYTCAAPPASPETDGAVSLRNEGEAMLAAVLADFERVPGVEAFTIRSPSDEEASFRAAVRLADGSLIIAPEFDRLLETRCQWVREEGGRLLGPSPEAVRLCSDKLALFQWWKERGVPTPSTREIDRKTRSSCGTEKVVWKPRFGAGGLHTFFGPKPL